MDRFAREPSGSVERLFALPVEIMLQFQTNVASAIQASSVGWLQRRQQAMEDALNTFDRLIRSRDIGEALAIQQQWFNNNIRRLGGAYEALAGRTATASREAVSSARESVNASHADAKDTAKDTAAHVMQLETRRERAHRPNVRRPKKKKPRKRGAA
jgi:hypothetical protein